MICINCARIPLDLFLFREIDRKTFKRGSVAPYVLHHSHAALEASANAGCHTCKLFHGNLHNNEPTTPRRPLSDGAVIIDADYGINWGERLSNLLFAVDGGFHRGFWDTLAISPDTDDNINMIKEWIDKCVQDHPHCRPEQDSWPPIRLVDVGSFLDPHSPRLVEGDECRRSGGKYLTLSHCWGSSAKDAPYKLTKASIDGFMVSIPIDILPKTFTEALIITRRLGQRYIWIDALCIIQDSAEDWQQQASHMARVYSGGLCMLGAASNSSIGGLFSKRVELEITCASVELKTRDGEMTKIVTFYPALPSDVNLLMGIPTTSRAWCLQEFELSPRTVQFTTSQNLWFCKSAQASEAMARRPSEASLLGMSRPFISRLHFAGDSGLEFDDYSSVYDDTSSDGESGEVGNKNEVTEDGRNNNKGEDDNNEKGNNSGEDSGDCQDCRSKSPAIYDRWYGLVSRYSRRKITYRSDTLPAISGLASYMHSQGHGYYLAGLWQNDVVKGLLWECVSPGTRALPFVAPSWSWASVVTPYGVTYRPCSEEIFKDSLLPTLVEADVQVTGRNPFGEVRSGRLSIRGVLATVRRERVCSLEGMLMQPLHHESYSEAHVGYIAYDCAWKLNTHDTLTLLYIFQEKIRGSARALALTPALQVQANKGVLYERVGHVIGVDVSIFEGAKEEHIVLI